jgi:threonine/homoserine/homoserine lactone efflux protein
VPDASTLIVFSGAALVLLIVPGPAVLYIVTRGATQGRTAALVSVAGIHVGTVVHVLAAVAGLSAVLATSAAAFTVVKLAGAVYLLHIGIQTLRRRHRDGDRRTWSAPELSLRRVFTDGVILNVLNPKTAMFFLAFVPQFVDVDATHAASQILVLGATFIVLGLVSDGAYALASGWLGDRVSHSPMLTRRRDIAAGTMYVTLGLATAVSGPVSTAQ